MGLYLHNVLITAIVFSVCFSDVCMAQCDQGWFGDGCQFQCHCAGNGECSQSGTCSDGCDPQWFGPACQYDVSEFNISGVSTEFDLSWLTDNNDTTCNTNGDLGYITASLDTPHPLTWVRVVVSDTGLKGVRTIRRNSHKYVKGEIESCKK
ncbi:U3 small nucleolar ribonucleoprotein imp3 [Plakobranchus ocellatus]|uniref:U3 small nucleolar ribonucleoprotein imp3 n=1 Tax=Plakobranchus ocellatus TaxID=259542 RepID=A0AAV3ZL90_9GAST|nr:U3 small nucleolar ribonucleoprotein imp3 [Plakobranchus ocellatus]